MRLATLIFCLCDAAVLAFVYQWGLGLRHEQPSGEVLDLLTVMLGKSLPPASLAIFLLTVVPPFIFSCVGFLPKTALAFSLFTPVLGATLLAYVMS